MPEKTQDSDPSWFGFILSVRNGNKKFSRNEIVKYLNSKKIDTRLLFSGNITKQPYLKKYKYISNSNLINSDFIMNNSFWIGLYPGLNKNHFDYVENVISEFITK